MAKNLTMIVKLSDCAGPFLAATYDLVQAVENSDPMLVTDEIREATTALLEIVEKNRGEL